MPRRPPRPSSRVRPGAPGAYVRRKDSIGRTYYLDRESGKRASKSTWELSRETVSFERKVEQDRPSPSGPRGGARPFPPGVGPTGRPEPVRRGGGPSGGGGGGKGGGGRRGEDSEPDDYEDPSDDWYEVDGEDDTGEA